MIIPLPDGEDVSPYITIEHDGDKFLPLVTTSGSFKRKALDKILFVTSEENTKAVFRLYNSKTKRSLFIKKTELLYLIILDIIRGEVMEKLDNEFAD